MRNHHWRICLIVGLLVSLGLWMQPANANKSSDPNRLIEPSMGFEFAQLDQWIPSIFAENGPQTNSQVAQRSIGFVHRTTPSLLAIVSSFANPKALSSSGWIKRYDYRRTNAAYQIETIEWQKRSVQLISEHQLSRQAHGTPDHLRLIIAINQQIMVLNILAIASIGLNSSLGLSRSP